MLGALLIKDWICVVDVDENAANVAYELQLLNESGWAKERQVAHLPGGGSSALYLDQLVVGPKGPVEKRELALNKAAFPLLTVSRQAWSIKKSLITVHELEADDGFFFRQTLAQRLTHIIGKAAAQWHGFAEEIVFCHGLRLADERDKAVERECFPAHGRIGSHQCAKKAVFFREDAPDGKSRIDVQRLKFPKVEEPQDGVHIRTCQENGRDGGAAGRACRGKFGIFAELLAEIWGSIQKEPRGVIRRNSDLRLRARTALELTFSQAATVGASAIPLGKTAPGCGAEDFNAHSNSG
jgi:hypothetical protein